MFEYVKDLGLPWPEGRTKRSCTDHIQIHHTVGDYGTEARWRSLHLARVASSEYRGIEYSFGVNRDGEIYEGRGLEYIHGAVRNDWTNGANNCSVSVTLIGDMRDADLPTEAQTAAAVRLMSDLLAYYKLPATAVYGHNEIKPYRKGDAHYTQCPVINMNDFRARLMVSKRDLMLTSPYMRGDDVRALQARLLEMGYDLDKWGADSIYGPVTDKAVRLLCSNAALLTPGIVDDHMRAMLGL